MKPWVQKMRHFQTYKMSIWFDMFRWTIWKLWPILQNFRKWEKKKKKKKRGGGFVVGQWGIFSVCVHLNQLRGLLLRSFPFPKERPLCISFDYYYYYYYFYSFPPRLQKNYTTYHFETLQGSCIWPPIETLMGSVKNYAWLWKYAPALKKHFPLNRPEP